MAYGVGYASGYLSITWLTNWRLSFIEFRSPMSITRGIRYLTPSKRWQTCVKMPQRCTNVVLYLQWKPCIPLSSKLPQTCTWLGHRLSSWWRAADSSQCGGHSALLCELTENVMTWFDHGGQKLSYLRIMTSAHLFCFFPRAVWIPGVLRDCWYWWYSLNARDSMHETWHNIYKENVVITMRPCNPVPALVSRSTGTQTSF